MTRPKIVLLGMLTKIPVAGVTWLVGQYAVGFQRLGFDVYYVEAHGRTPSMFMSPESDDGMAAACAFLEGQLGRFGLAGRWAYHDVHGTGACHGMSDAELRRLYAEAALILNLHGSTVPLEEHAASGRLVYVGTDPVDVEIELAQGMKETVAYLEPHVAFFTWGLNYGNPDCLLPWSEQFPFVAAPPPVVLDLWEHQHPPGDAFTTVGNWRQEYRDIVFDGERYTWSKHHEFLKVLDLPSRVNQPLELALSSYTTDDRRHLEAHGWTVRDGLALSRDALPYRDYIARSRGEFSAAKDQNVRLRSGWFSERSATYLAAGRPVILQDTGFTNVLPLGAGLFGFSDLEGAAAAIDSVNSDYDRHRNAATEIARTIFNYDVSLVALLDHVGLAGGVAGRQRASSVEVPAVIAADLDLVPVSRRPLELPSQTVEQVSRRPVPCVAAPPEPPAASVVVPVLDNYACTRLALESVLASPTDVPYELIVVDNGSQRPTREYLSVLASRNPHVRVIRNEVNAGFAAAVNQGLRSSTGATVVLLNNDTVVTPGWLDGLLAHLADTEVGLLCPVTNRCGNEAEVPTSYTTYVGLLDEAAARQQHVGPASDIPVAVMFCVALRRDVLDAVGPLDERFGIGLFEDDDYSRRVRAAGFRVACAEDVLVHHFGEATIGDTALAGPYGELFDANRRRFEDKWGVTWSPHGRRQEPSYRALVDRVRAVTGSTVTPGATVLVLSKGDDSLVDLPTATGWHFPRLDDGRYAGAYPADDGEAIGALEAARRAGADFLVVPAFATWWFDHYTGFRNYLDDRYVRLTPADAEAAVVYELAVEVQ